MRSFADPASTDGRYHRRQGPGVWYASDQEQAAWAELFRHFTEEGVDPFEVRRRVGRVVVEGPEVLDLTSEQVRATLGLTLEDLVGDDYQRTQAVTAAVLEVFSSPDTYRGACLPVVGDVISPAEMIEAFSRLTGLKAEYRSAYSREGLLTYFPAPGENSLAVDEILGMAQYAVDLGYFRDDRDTTWSRRIDPHTLSWEQFLRKTDWHGEPIAFGH